MSLLARSYSPNFATLGVYTTRYNIRGALVTVGTVVQKLSSRQRPGYSGRSRVVSRSSRTGKEGVSLAYIRCCPPTYITAHEST